MNHKFIILVSLLIIASLILAACDIDRSGTLVGGDASIDPPTTTLKERETLTLCAPDGEEYVVENVGGVLVYPNDVGLTMISSWPPMEESSLHTDEQLIAYKPGKNCEEGDSCIDVWISVGIGSVRNAAPPPQVLTLTAEPY